MSTHPLAADRSSRTDPMRVLEDIKRLALEPLGGLPASLYEPVEEALKAAGRGEEAADTPQLLYQNQAALWVLRQHQAAHVMGFRQNVGHGFDEFRVLRIRNRGSLPLGLIGDEQIDLHLAGQNLGEALEHRFKPVLEEMGARLQVLAAVLGLPPTPNPIAPSRLATAFVETFADEQVPPALRVLLFGQFERELDGLLGELYGRVNTLLARNGYGMAQPAAKPRQPARTEPPVEPAMDPSLSDPMAPFADGAAGVAAGAGVGDGYDHDEFSSAGVQAGHGGASAAGGQQASAGTASGAGSASADAGSSHPGGELGELSDMLRAWREGRFAPPGTSATEPNRPSLPRRELKVKEVVGVASLLQGEPADAFARALAGSGRLGGAIREQLNDGARRLGIDPEQVRFSRGEEDAIDLVALLFDSLFQSHQLADRARRLYARLVLPFVKVALTDSGLFVEEVHPARKLLDAITEACAGNKGETPQERELLDRAAAASQRVVAEYNEDLAVFELAHSELDALLRQQRRRIELQAERAAKATYGRERLNLAREQADAALGRRLAAPPLSEPVADFLATSWRHHLIQTLLREGADSERYQEAVRLGDTLVEADRLASQGRGGELAERLLAMQPAIIDCLGSSGLDPRGAEHGFAVLVRGLAFPDAARDLRPAPAAEADEETAERGLWIAGGTDTLRFEPAMAERMRELQPGDWLQLMDRDGESVDAKIAWISPLTARRLLVNRRGLRVLVASPEELASLLAAGRLQLGVEPTPFEQAMRHVRQQLDQAVGHA